MEEWKEYIVGDLGRVVTGKTPKTSVVENYGGTIPFLTPSDDLSGKFSPETIKKITELGLHEVKNCLLPTGSVCVSCIGSDLGKVVIIKKPTVTNQQFNSIIPNKENDADFIYYLMTIIGKHLNFLSKTSTAVPIINKSTFASYPIRVPSLETQKRIASILSSLDDKIELNRKINANLEAQAQALFKSWFVDFEPFKDQPFIESELGMIPEGWRVGEIGDYCNIRSGFAFKSSWWSDNGIKVIKIKNITEDGRIDISDCSFVSKEHAMLAKEFQTKVGDLLIAMTGATIGKFCIIPTDTPMCVNQRVGKFFLGDKPLEKLPFIYYNLKRPNIFEEIVRKGQGSAQPNISGKDIESIKLVFPPDSIISRFNQSAIIYIKRGILNEQESRRLASLRDTLLPRLMSGELKVNEVI